MKTVLHQGKFYVVQGEWPEKPSKDISFVKSEQGMLEWHNYESAIASCLSSAIPVIQEDYDVIVDRLPGTAFEGHEGERIQDLTPYSVEVELEKVANIQDPCRQCRDSARMQTRGCRVPYCYKGQPDYKRIAYRVKQSTK